ncbi:MAG: DUF5828 family protein [Haloferacaceae archaeon]|jgi:hypothetical protein|nr:DUF5828 family protein [Haloferacaceae archaeon]
MEVAVSGFSIIGTWDEVVEHGERITYALEEEGVASSAFDEWCEWRPKSHERLRDDVREKTAAQASVRRGRGERAGIAPNEDLQTAGASLSAGAATLGEGAGMDAARHGGRAVGHLRRAVDSAVRALLRRLEHVVYRRIMTRMSPFYFDNLLISANIDRSDRRGPSQQYHFEVDIADDGLKHAVADRLDTYEDRYPRWHGEVRKDTTVAEEVEGVEPPRPRAD